jgi:hypothetical protein
MHRLVHALFFVDEFKIDMQSSPGYFVPTSLLLLRQKPLAQLQCSS